MYTYIYIYLCIILPQSIRSCVWFALGAHICHCR